MHRASWAWWPPPMVVAITASICAAGLVLYLQHRAISTLQSQTRVILRQISEQTASDIAVELHRMLDGPVFDTLTAVNHPDLRAGRLDLVANEFVEGLKAYPHVDRFFAWNQKTDAEAPGEAMFFGRDGRFARDPGLSAAVMALARRHAPSQHIYVAAEHVGPDRRHHAFLRLFWTDASRVEYFAILGFVVDAAKMRDQLFGALRTTRLDDLLTRRGGDVPLQLRVIDERGTLVYGAASPGTMSGVVQFPMVFYPANEIQSRLAAAVESRMWRIEVSPAASSDTFARAGLAYWPSALSVVLMLIALGLTMQAQRRSAQLARMQTDFVAHVSHQLKTPLSLLSAATETLQMDRIRSPERLSEYLGTIHAEAARLASLVQRVLEFSRVQQKRQYEFESVDLGALVRETVDAFAHGLSSQHFSFAVQQQGPGPYVMADPAALEQVLANLLDNAVKYSDQNRQVTVRVSATRTAAILEVIDRGAGIRPGDERRIFERFYRAPGAPHRPGFGLGLPIVRELVRAHGGTVEVAASAPGMGSTFRVTLPRHAQDARESNAVSAEPLENQNLNPGRLS